MSSILFYSTRKSKTFRKKIFEKITQKNGPSGSPGPARASPWHAKVSPCRKIEREDPLRFFNIHSVAKHEKIEENKKFNFREKISQCRKKLKGGTLWDFPTSLLSQNIKKMQGDPFGKKFRKKCLAVPKNIERGDSLVSPSMVCYAEKQVKPFWSSSLGQMVQFDTIIFCRTFKNYFGQFHEAPTKNWYKKLPFKDARGQSLKNHLL